MENSGDLAKKTGDAISYQNPVWQQDPAQRAGLEIKKIGKPGGQWVSGT